MIKLGITGGIGSGKSTVSTILTLLGIPVYIADIESKKLLNSSQTIKLKLTSLLGNELYINNEINKNKLASFIFANNKNLETVNNIIHPVVKDDFFKWTESNRHHNIIAQESAILFESGFNKLFNKIITVYSPIDTRIARVMKRDNCSKESVIERINKQLSDEEKVTLSDFVIYNDESESLIEQSIDLINKISILDANNRGII